MTRASYYKKKNRVKHDVDYTGHKPIASLPPFGHESAIKTVLLNLNAQSRRFTGLHQGTTLARNTNHTNRNGKTKKPTKTGK